MPVFVEESNLPTLTKAGVLKYLLQKVIMKATHSIFLFFRILCHFDYHLRAPCSICDFGDLERQWALPVTILWLPLLSGFGGGWRQRGRQIKYLIPFIRQDINRSTVFQQRFQSPFPWSAAAQYPISSSDPIDQFSSSRSSTVIMMGSNMIIDINDGSQGNINRSAQYQYWASNEINQMLMDPNNEIGINDNIAAIVFSIAHMNPPV